MQLLPLASFVAFAAALCGVEAALFPKSSKVTLLDATNFKREVLDIEKPTMVAFTAPWCGHCQRLVPDYTKVAGQLDGVVKLAAIDCDEEKNKPVCGKYGIQGFPTLKLFPPTKKRLPKDYQGARVAKDIATYMIDSLPMSAKKLMAEELQQFAEYDADTPKVILFSKKPTSSPLYKSLALDFRKSLTFAFLRGDQQPVRSAARVHLGVDVDESKLPLLIVIPSRAEGSDIDKKQIKTYTGQLKYHELNKWIKATLPEAASGKKKKTPTQPSRSEPPKHKAVKLDEDIDDLPSGAQREWRVEEEMTEEERKAKMQKLADMINAAAAARQDAGNIADNVASKAKQAAEDAYENVKEKVVDAGAKVADVGAKMVNSGSPSKESLRESIQQWLEGENVDWSGDYATKFDQAQQEAAELIRKDPKKAEELALEGEKWLADHLISDIELMTLARDKGNTNPSLSDEKLQRVQGMYDELLKRIKQREDRLQTLTSPHDEL